VQHVDAFGKRRNVEDPMLKTGPDPNLPNTGADSSQRLPVIGLEALLNSTQLEAGDPPGEAWKRPQVRTGRPKPEHPFIGHDSLCKYSYNMSTMVVVGRSHNYCMQRTAGRLAGAISTAALARRS